MTETMTLQLDETVMERLRLVAHTHHCAVETLAAQVLDDLLPCAADMEPAIRADWGPEETAFLSNAVQAFETIQPIARAAAVPVRSTGRSRG